MKKLFLPFLLVFVCISILKAQYVTIPDPNFRATLKQLYPTCFNANDEMDTQCGLIKNATSLNVNFSNISNLTGIEYFTSLDILYCSNNQLSYLPNLPGSLTRLDCQNNQLIYLPTLPTLLTTLNCSVNQLTNLFTLPTSLTILSCAYNRLTSLPSIPASLISLNCEGNQITSLPTLPGSLTSLFCDHNKLTSLPILPATLTALNCEGNLITSLPTLPSNLPTLNCDHNQLTSLPTLPASLINLYCNSNNLTSLPTLPASLLNLNCEDNLITSLPSLPGSLINLHCGYNNLSTLISLPGSLYYLYCSDNKLSTLPSLPGSLVILDCSRNQLTSLSTLPSSLTTLNCYNNLLTCLPFLPANLSVLGVSGNQISCFPNLPNTTFSTDIAKTVCSPTNNVNGCALYPVISGKVYFDINKNGVQDAGENAWTNASIEIQPGNYLTATDMNGNYSINVDTGSYTITFNNSILPYYSIFPGTHAAVLHNFGQVDTQNDFALKENTSTNNLQVTITSLSNARPGRSVGYVITYMNIGTTTLSGTTSLSYDSQLNYDSTSFAFASHTGTNIVWNYTNLLPGQSRNIRVYFTLPQTITLGTKLNFTATVNPTIGDYTPTDNIESFQHTVRGSYDPNFKEVLPEGDISPAQVTSQDPFTYVVHFQNTGTDTAFVVSIKDTISNNFEILTVETLAASHNYSFTMNNGAIEWKFNNILLVDSIINEPLSHGFVKYRIIPKNTLVVGDQIENTAHIFFDYNLPVATNTTLNKITIPTSINQSEASALLNIYPNPSKGSATISYGIAEQGTIKVLSTDSRIVYSQNVDFANPTTLDLSTEPKGIYIIEVANGENVVRKKLVVQ